MSLRLPPHDISRVQNNYSYILAGMPTYGIAQGSIFDVFGINLATTTTDLQSAPLRTLNGAGNGPAAVFDVNAQHIGLTNAANPGDFITLWGSGLGPVTGDETVAQTPANFTTIPVEVFIGLRPVVVQYAGRSVYPGLDQINVQVPAGVSGCHVSIVVKIGDMLSNFGTIPVLCRPDNSADVTFSRFTNAQYAAKQPFAGVSFTDCMVYNFTNANFAIPNPIKPVLLNAGPTVTLTTPSGTGFGTIRMPFQDGGYSADGLMMASGGSLRGTYVFAGSGGPDIGAFSAQVTWPGGGGGFHSRTLNNITSVSRSQGLTVIWNQPSSTDPTENIQVSGFAHVANAPNGAEFFCNVPLAAGRFTIPPVVLLALPSQASLAQPQATLEVDLIVNAPFTAPGADLGIAVFLLADIQPFSYQ